MGSLAVAPPGPSAPSPQRWQEQGRPRVTSQAWHGVGDRAGGLAVVAEGTASLPGPQAGLWEEQRRLCGVPRMGWNCPPLQVGLLCS